MESEFRFLPPPELWACGPSHNPLWGSRNSEFKEEVGVDQADSTQTGKGIPGGGTA